MEWCEAGAVQKEMGSPNYYLVRLRARCIIADRGLSQKYGAAPIILNLQVN